MNKLKVLFAIACLANTSPRKARVRVACADREQDTQTHKKKMAAEAHSLSDKLRQVLANKAEFDKVVQRFFTSNDIDANAELDRDEFGQVCLF